MAWKKTYVGLFTIKKAARKFKLPKTQVLSPIFIISYPFNTSLKYLEPNPHGTSPLVWVKKISSDFWIGFFQSLEKTALLKFWLGIHFLEAGVLNLISPFTKTSEYEEIFNWQFLKIWFYKFQLTSNDYIAEKALENTHIKR